jgi:hypothetical protein
MALRDVGRGGAQVESFVKLAAGSLHRATFSCEGIEAAVQVCVRHVKPVVSSSGEMHYLMGMEFVGPSPVVIDLIERWLMRHGDGAFLAGDAN